MTTKLIVAVIIVASIIFIVLNIPQSKLDDVFKSKPGTFSVRLHTNAPQSDTEDLMQKIERLPGVSGVTYLSSEQQLQTIKEKYPEIAKNVDQTNSMPFQPYINGTIDPGADIDYITAAIFADDTANISDQIDVRLNGKQFLKTK